MAIASHRLSLAASFGAALFCISGSAFAFSIFTVGPGSDCPYSTIQAAVDAARDTPGVDYVWISNDLVSGTRHDYLNEHVVVNDADGVVIEGGFVSCADPNIDPPEYTVISGAGNDGGPVFEIAGAGGDVSLNNLYITGANRDDDASGGGVSFTGMVGGTLFLFNTNVTGNHAGYGGGINVDGRAATAAIKLGANSLIINNTATTSGGGIRVEGDTRLYALEPQTLIAFNHAPGGYGGGIEVLGPARADIGSPGYSGGAVVQFNTALYGGGIAALAINSGEGAVARIFTTDPQNPVQIADNTAERSGGAVYLHPLQTIANGAAGAAFCAYDFRIHGNIAQEGAAVYADEDFDGVSDYQGTFVFINEGSPACGFDSPPDLGAVACDASAPCNEINENLAQDSSEQPTDGSTILVQSEGGLTGTRFSMRGNEGAHALRQVNDAQTDVFIDNCLIADNQMTGELIYGVGDPDGGNASVLSIKNCTLAGNAIAATNVVRAEANVLDLIDSIVDQPGIATLSFTGATANIDHVLSNDTSTLPVNDGVMQGEPTFVDAASGDYHLQPTSLGVDFAPDVSGLDLDRHPRTVDLSGIGNEDGALDLGAYEIQSVVLAGCAVADTVYCDGFES